MSQIETLKSFEDRNVRVVWDDELQEWFFCIVDVVEALTGSTNPSDYLKKMRRRDAELAKGWGQIVTPLVVETTGGKQKTNFADVQGVSRIIQTIASPKTEQFKQWLEQFASESQSNNIEQLPDIENVQGEIVLYQPDETIRMEVRLENDTVWLTQTQIIELFQSSKANISEHIANIYEQGELLYEATVRNFRTVQKEGNRKVNRVITYYNLDVIISVGFRVNAKRGIRFRQWANGVIKNYLLHGYAINQQLMRMEHRVDAKLDAQQKQIQRMESAIDEHQEKIDFFVRTNLPPVEGIFYDGQIFDAYACISNLIKQAKQNITLIDNYIDETTLTMLSKRSEGVTATIYTRPLTQQQQLDMQQHNQQYQTITVNTCQRNHDRFLIIDNEVYLFGASLKDAGKKLFAYIRMNETDATELLNMIH